MANRPTLGERIDGFLHGQKTVAIGTNGYSTRRIRRWDGEKWDGGIPEGIDWLRIDYAALRERSATLFESNHFARGIIRRLVTMR